MRALIFGGLTTYLIHNLPRIRLTDELETDDAVHDALQPDPDRFDARLAVAFARQETAEHGHQSQDLVESWWVSRRLLLVEEIGGMPFILVEEQVGGQVRTRPAESHQHRNPPGDDQVQRDGALQCVDRLQLQGLDPAAVLENVEEDLDLPTIQPP